MPFVVRRGTRNHNDDAFSTMQERWSAEWEPFRGSPERDFRDSEHYTVLSERGLMPPSGARVLEAGCGYAHIVRSLHALGYDVVGLDYAEGAIELSRERWPDLQLVQGDLRAMPFEDNSFDLIVSLGAVEHNVEGPERALDDMLRVLKPGGTLYCSVPCISTYRKLGALRAREFVVNNATIRSLTGRNPATEFYEYNYTIAEYQALLEERGFTVREMVPLRPHTRLARGPMKQAIAQVHARVPSFFAHMVTAIATQN